MDDETARAIMKAAEHIRKAQAAARTARNTGMKKCDIRLAAKVVSSHLDDAQVLLSTVLLKPAEGNPK